jgi:hypothetical protein
VTGTLVSLCLIGVLSQYSPGVFEQVVRVRQAGRTAMNLPAALPTVDGFLAARDCDTIGQVWTVRYRSHVERLLVADCAGDSATRAWMDRNRILGEVDGATAARWDVIGRGARDAQVCREVTR